MKEKNLVKKIEIVFLFLLIIFTVIYRLQSINMPLDKNEGAFAYAAVQVSHGSLLYKDVFEHRPPMIVYIYKTAFSLFGQTQLAIRNFTTLYLIATLLLMYMLSRIIWRSAFISMLAAFFYILYQHSLIFQGLTADTAIYAQLPLILSILFIFNRDEKYELVNFSISGFFAAVALLTHLMTLFFALVPIIYILAYCKKNKIKNLISFIVGYVVLIAMVIGWAVLKNNLLDMYNGLIFYNFEALKLSIKSVINYATFQGWMAFAYANIFLCLSIIYAVWMFYKRKNNEIDFLLIATLFVLYLGIILSNNVPSNFYLSLIPAGSLLGAVMINDMYIILTKEKTTKKYMWMLLAAFMIVNTLAILKANHIGQFLNSNKYAQEILYEESSIVETIASGSQNKEKKDNFIFVWPDMPEIYFMSGVKATSKYAYAYPLEVFREDKIKVLDNFFYGRPAWVVMQKGTYQPFQAFLDNYYAKEMQTQNLVLYRSLLY
ncbi:MAG: glycosyltransferase family 39 protein [bacterium]